MSSQPDAEVTLTWQFKSKKRKVFEYSASSFVFSLVVLPGRSTIHSPPFPFVFCFSCYPPPSSLSLAFHTLPLSFPLHLLSLLCPSPPLIFFSLSPLPSISSFFLLLFQIFILPSSLLSLQLLLFLIFHFLPSFHYSTHVFLSLLTTLSSISFSLFSLSPSYSPSSLCALSLSPPFPLFSFPVYRFFHSSIFSLFRFCLIVCLSDSHSVNPPLCISFSLSSSPFHSLPLPPPLPLSPFPLISSLSPSLLLLLPFPRSLPPLAPLVPRMPLPPRSPPPGG